MKAISLILLAALLVLSLMVRILMIGNVGDLIREQTGDMLLSTRPITVTNHSDLILFLHFHKAGGSSIVAAARRNQNLYLPNRNGNTFNRNNGKSIPFWTFPSDKLRMFLSYCRSHDTTFIAAENNWFSGPSGFDERLREEYRMMLVTQIRDPFSRFVSDFLFQQRKDDWQQFLAPKVYDGALLERLKGYHLERHRGTHWNMYVRVLNRQFDRNVTEEDLEIAKRELDKFDLVVVMEIDDSAQLWRANCGFNIEHRKANIQYEQIYAAEREADSDFDEKWEGFRVEYERLNRFDYEIYEYAKELHRRFAAGLRR